MLQYDCRDDTSSVVASPAVEILSTLKKNLPNKGTIRAILGFWFRIFKPSSFEWRAPIVPFSFTLVHCRDKTEYRHFWCYASRNLYEDLGSENTWISRGSHFRYLLNIKGRQKLHLLVQWVDIKEVRADFYLFVILVKFDSWPRRATFSGFKKWQRWEHQLTIISWKVWGLHSTEVV